MVQAFVLAWGLFRLPDFLERFEIISVEEDRFTPLADQVALYSRADMVVREKATGHIYVFNNKTCEKWDPTEWLFDLQMQTEAMAEGWHLKQPIAGCLVEGFVKGGRYAGLLSSRLLYAYRLKDGRLNPGSYSGGQKVFIPSIMPLREWIEQLPVDIINDSLVRSEIIPIREVLLERWIKGVVRKETDNYLYLTDPEVTEEDRLGRFDWTINKFNCRGCPFHDACFDLATIEGMVESGRLRQRVGRRTGNIL